LALDAKKAEEINLKLLKRDPRGNVRIYLATVSNLMGDKKALMDVARADTNNSAKSVIDRYPKLSSSEKHKFLRGVCNWYYYDETKKIIFNIREYASEKGNKELLVDALMLQGKVFFSMERAQEAIKHFTELEEGYKGMFSNSDKELISDYIAMSSYWIGNYNKAAELFEKLQKTAPAPDSENDNRTIPYYVHWQGISLIGAGDYATAKALLEKAKNQYSENKWGKRSAEYLKHLTPLIESLDARVGKAE